MIIHASSRIRHAQAARTGAFVNAGAAMIAKLVVRRANDDLRSDLSAAAAALEAGGVLLVKDHRELAANGTPVPSPSAAFWRAQMTAAAVRAVDFMQGTSERELLLFLAFLAAPGDAGAFRATWIANGSWRIHVTSDRVSAAGEGDGSTLPVVRDTLGDLCEAVAQGRAQATESPVLAALRGHGSEATATLLGRLNTSETGCQRRFLFDAIVAVGHGADHLIAAVQHDDWHIVRNAAALLGELKVERAASSLSNLCAHEEFRVRVAAVTALGQLDGFEARAALPRCVHDRHPSVRARAWFAMSDGAEPPNAALLDTALRHENHVEVQQALLACAARFPDLDVSGGLTRFCARAMSRDASNDLLLFGVEQLAIRRPHAAKSFIARLPERMARAM